MKNIDGITPIERTTFHEKPDLEKYVTYALTLIVIVEIFLCLMIFTN
jgi:hypothetical protein